MSRTGCALFKSSEARLETFVDDPWSAWRGSPERIMVNQAVLLVWWMCLGLPLSWSKVQRGDRVVWIGAQIQTSSESTVLTLPVELLDRLLEETRDLLRASSVGLARLRRYAGRLSWVAGVVWALKAVLSPLWAALADRGGAAGGTVKGEGKVAVVRIAHALKWIHAFLSRKRGSIERTYRTAERFTQVVVQLVTDASPWGLGAILYLDGKAHEYLADQVTDEDVELLGVTRGDHRSQSVLEALAVLVAVRCWLPKFSHLRFLVVTRSDSIAAVGALVAGRSGSAAMNMVVREVTLDLAECVYRLDVAKHIKGTENVFADALSRLHDTNSPKEIPLELKHVKRAVAERRDEAWWRARSVPEPSP